MTDKNIIIIIILNILSIINVFWATNLQTKCDVSSYNWPIKYFMHSLNPGSVCEFGIQSGRLICAFLLLNILLTYMYRNNKYQLKILKYLNITVLIVVFVLSLLMNSGLNYYVNHNFYQRGLWENLIPFWICSVINIVLLNKLI